MDSKVKTIPKEKSKQERKFKLVKEQKAEAKENASIKEIFGPC